MELSEFIGARLDEDEAAAKAATPGPWSAEEFIDEDVPMGPEYQVATDDYVVVGGGPRGMQPKADTIHVARHDPARVLREVAAKRAHLAAYDEAVNGINADFGVADALEGVLKADAAVYSDHPDYDPQRHA